MLEPEVEVGRVDAHEHRGRLGQQLALQVVANTQDFGNVPQRFDIAAHGQLFHWPVRVETRGDHARAADSVIVRGGGQAAREAVQQRRRQQVAGRLAGHHRDA